MIIIIAVFGLILGSFVNALVWRIHEQADLAGEGSGQKDENRRTSHSKVRAAAAHQTAGSKRAPQGSNSKARDLSITRGRSMCPKCGHELGSLDLVPVLSWVFLRGKCRYCRKPISAQYPLVELLTAGLFVVSYLCWPKAVHGGQVVLLIIWLLALIGLMALMVYDLRWYLLPNRIIYPLSGLAGLYAISAIVQADKPLTALINTILAVAIGGGIFYVLFQVSAGKWIGGGDVRLGWLLGLLVGTPARAVLFIFLASILGTAVSLPLLGSHRLKRHSVIPFGPFLIAGAIITQLFGGDIIHWYTHTLLLS